MYFVMWIRDAADMMRRNSSESEVGSFRINSFRSLKHCILESGEGKNTQKCLYILFMNALTEAGVLALTGWLTDCLTDDDDVDNASTDAVV